jgi:hypothetical protein
MPFFNAGTERFIRDWKTAEVIVTLRDNRMREHDALLGAVQLNLRDVFKNASQMIGFYPISGGIGYGKIRISLVFRAVELRLSRKFLSWDVGAVEITSHLKVIQGNDEVKFSGQKVRLHTMNRSTKIRAGHAHTNDDGSTEWKLPTSPLRMPFNRRYSSALVVAFHSWGSKPNAMAILWLKDLVDEDQVHLRLPIWKTKDYTQLEQNCLIDENNAENEMKERFDAKRIGWVEFSACSKRGMGTGGPNKVRSQKGHQERMLAEAHEAAQDGQDCEDGEKISVDSVRTDDEAPKHRRVDESDSSSSSSSSTDGDAVMDVGADKKGKSANGHRFKGPKRMYQEYKERRHELHKRERGAMQNKGLLVRDLADGSCEEYGLD